VILARKKSCTTYQEFFLLFLGRLVIESTGLDDLVVDVQLETGTSIHRFFDAFLGDEAQNTNGLRLANTMSAILSLEIGVRIPITVEAAEERRCPVKSLGDLHEKRTYIMTVSAVCKFKPRPPALVDKIKTLISESFALKCWTWVARSSVFVPPSRRRYAQPIIFKKSSMISMTFVIWKKMRTCTKRRSVITLVICCDSLCGQWRRTWGGYGIEARSYPKNE
jgi:hypothetical protein